MAVEQEQPRRVVVALVACWTALGAGALLLAAAHGPAPALLPVALLAACAVIVEARPTIVGPARVRASLTGGVIVLAAVVTGPLGGGLVGLAAALADGGPPRFRRPVYGGVQCVMGVASGLAIDALDVDVATGSGAVAAVAVASLVASALNLLGLASVVVALRGGVRRVVVPAAGLLAVGTVVWLPVPVAVAVAHAAFGAIALPLVLLPLAVTEALGALVDERRRLDDAVHGERVGAALALVRVLDARDQETAAHSAAVAVYAGDLAEAAGLGPEIIWRVRLGALLHDIGKVAVPTAVLGKRGPLDPAEWALVRDHPVVGERILGDAPAALGIVATIRHHHERPDGAGYPDGLAGRAIPLEAAIVAVADTYAAMTHVRPYRSARTPAEAIAELERSAGSALDADLVATFCALLAAESEGYRSGRGTRFAFGAVAADLRSAPRSTTRGGRGLRAATV